jgi:hypothetical protein
MTTPTPPQTARPSPIPALGPGATANETEAEFERLAQLQNPQIGMRARALDNEAAPPPAGPRDLAGLGTAMAGAYAAFSYYFDQPGWNAITQIHQNATSVLAVLSAQAERNPQAAIQAARITTLAASLIARHAAHVSAYLDTWNLRNSPGAEAMRVLTRVAETHAAQAAGLQDGQKLDTPQSLLAHVYKLNKELQRAEATRPGPPTDPKLEDPDDPALDSSLSIGAVFDRALAEAAKLNDALSELAARGRRIGHRGALDVRLHGMIEAVQLRGFEMISGIARAVMNRYDSQGRQNEGRRTIAATIFHYAEQRLERMRGALGADEQRDPGYYEADPPDRYMDALFDEQRTVVDELKATPLRTEDRTDLQIRFLMVQRAFAAVDEGNREWGVEPHYPPRQFVAGMRAENPVDARLELIDALRARVERDPHHRDAAFLNQAADAYALELAGPVKLTAAAEEAVITTTQLRQVAQHLAEEGAIASPLVLTNSPHLNLTYPEAERALHELQTHGVVGPRNGLKPRKTLIASPDQLPEQLRPRVPQAPAQQRQEAAVQGAAAAPVAPAAAPVDKDLLRRAALLAADNWKPSAQLFVQYMSVTLEEGHALMGALHERKLLQLGADGEWEPTFIGDQVDDYLANAPVPAAAAQGAGQSPPQPTTAAQAQATPTLPPELPRRDRSADRRHPGNRGTRPTPAAEAPTDQDLAQLLEGQEDRVKEVSQKLIAGTEARAAAHPAPTENAPAKTTTADEAQHNAQQNQQTVGGGVR